MTKRVEIQAAQDLTDGLTVGKTYLLELRTSGEIHLAAVPSLDEFPPTHHVVRHGERIKIGAVAGQPVFAWTVDRTNAVVAITPTDLIDAA